MHLPSAKTPHIVHPAICLCVTHQISQFKFWKKHTHTGCTGFKVYAPCSQNVHTGCRVHPSLFHRCTRSVPPLKVRLLSSTGRRGEIPPMLIGLCLHWSLDNYKQSVEKQPIRGERLIYEYEIKTYLNILNAR